MVHCVYIKMLRTSSGAILMSWIFSRINILVTSPAKLRVSENNHPCSRWFTTLRPHTYSSKQWRRQLWGTGARAPLDFQQFNHFILVHLNLIVNYPSMCSLPAECLAQMSTTHTLSISTTLVTKLLVIKPLLHPVLKSAGSAPWHNFQLCPSSQQILATPLLQNTGYRRSTEWSIHENVQYFVRSINRVSFWISSQLDILCTSAVERYNAKYNNSPFTRHLLSAQQSSS